MCVFDQLFMKYLYKQPLQLHLSKKCLIYNTLSIKFVTKVHIYVKALMEEDFMCF